MIELALIVVGVYLGSGILFVLPFLLKGLPIVDEGARAGTMGFKIIIIPGVIVFWPALLSKWIKAVKSKM